MGAVVSQITSLTIVYSTVDSDADQWKHQSSASLAFVRGIHREPVYSPHKWPVTGKMFPFEDVFMTRQRSCRSGRLLRIHVYEPDNSNDQSFTILVSELQYIYPQIFTSRSAYIRTELASSNHNYVCVRLLMWWLHGIEMPFSLLALFVRRVISHGWIPLTKCQQYGGILLLLDWICCFKKQSICRWFKTWWSWHNVIVTKDPKLYDALNTDTTGFEINAPLYCITVALRSHYRLTDHNILNVALPG